jgi:preprotein translocase subunit SecA
MHLDPATGEDELALAQINARIEAGDFAPRALSAADPAPERDPNNPETWGRIGRNEACPCGSGKKYKHCHGVLA